MSNMIKLVLIILFIVCQHNRLESQIKSNYSSDKSFLIPSRTSTIAKVKTDTSKRPIDLSVLDSWPSFWSKPIISGNGKYFAYTLRNHPLNHKSFVVKSIHEPWHKEFVCDGIKQEDYHFSEDNAKLIWRSIDTMFILYLGTDSLVTVTGIKNLVFPKKKSAEWIIYCLKGSNDMYIYNIVTTKIHLVKNVSDFEINDIGSDLVFSVVVNRIDGSKGVDVIWFELFENKMSTIWRGSYTKDTTLSVGKFSFNSDYSKAVFLVTESIGKIECNSLWLCKKSEGVALKLVDADFNNKLKRDVVVSNSSPEFSKNGRWIFFKLDKRNVDSLLPTNATKVTVWSYKDLFLPPDQQRKMTEESKKYTAVISVDGREPLQLISGDEFLLTEGPDVPGDHLILFDRPYTPNWWTHSLPPAAYVISLVEGKKIRLRINAQSIIGFCFSPDGKHLIFWDKIQNSFISYDLTSGKEVNITKNISTSFLKEIQTTVYNYPISLEPAGWMDQGNTTLLYDNYDIWKVDLSGKNIPINITCGYGKKNQIKFRLVGAENSTSKKINIYSDSDTVLLVAFDAKSRKNGFFKKQISSKSNPQILTMGPYTYYKTISQIGGTFYSFGLGNEPIKARDERLWIIQRSSVSEAPNLFYTKDFKQFVQLTYLAPQKEINWLTSELVTWKMFNGETGQGILYKPENFDSTKKYPVIFNYYETLSHRLYEFPYPHFTRTNINIPYFVSNGYLVFTPDINFKVGAISGRHVGEWAFNAVVSAAKNLAQLPFVDKNKMAIQGHSFGGLITAYLVTSTNLFAAAVEVAGSTDPISRYLTLIPLFSSVEHSSAQEGIEEGHEMYGATPWERPDLFLKASAVLNAHNVITPLLIVHNEQDNQVQWRQGVELFMAMRRLGKRCWLLQYDGSGHGLSGSDGVDFTIRLTQFFDHYLKGAPAPIWMTNGIPASQKGKINGYEFDPKTPKP